MREVPSKSSLWNNKQITLRKVETQLLLQITHLLIFMAYSKVKVKIFNFEKWRSHDQVQMERNEEITQQLNPN